MQELIGKVKAGKIKQARARMGWQYYVKHGIAAVLLCFLLSCVVMPEKDAHDNRSACAMDNEGGFR